MKFFLKLALLFMVLIQVNACVTSYPVTHERVQLASSTVQNIKPHLDSLMLELSDAAITNSLAKDERLTDPRAVQLTHAITMKSIKEYSFKKINYAPGLSRELAKRYDNQSLHMAMQAPNFTRDKMNELIIDSMQDGKFGIGDFFGIIKKMYHFVGDVTPNDQKRMKKYANVLSTSLRFVTKHMDKNYHVMDIPSWKLHSSTKELFKEHGAEHFGYSEKEAKHIIANALKASQAEKKKQNDTH